MSRREAILARAALLASSSSSSSSASAQPELLQDDGDSMRALRRRPPTVPLEERSERINAPFRPRGDRPVPPRSRPVVADAPSSMSLAPVKPRSIDPEALAKADAKLLLKLKTDQPIIEQAFSLSAPAKVPKAVRQKFLNTLAAKKLREAAGVGAHKDILETWIHANIDACRSAVKDAVDEEIKIHVKATSKVTYRNLSAQLLLRGGTSPKPPPGALAQDYQSNAADLIDLVDARTVRGDALVFFVHACKRRKGDAHSRWLDPVIADEDESTHDEAPLSPLASEVVLEPFVEIKSPIIDGQNVKNMASIAPLTFDDNVTALPVSLKAVEAPPSARAAVVEFTREHFAFLIAQGLTTSDVADVVESKVVKKVMKVHAGAKDGSFLAKEAPSVKKLIESQIAHETKSVGKHR
jgi:hypothetical protein|mmetsp:Transcript_6471/g.23417  ORF Transcript_6471/g.23417 Transcript_6471/m.23417 type:complete len:410 (-) Transcript_6471:41-1270(-)|eukprot:CAMPEP_0179717540 /NCGR_PEP_ID=MMETSP0938-20121108/2439_1 /TAXON_ID=548131 ORGANISM="Ostreococcus mediterraneus, Strain clade-D-RCC1107" /NCGR_SAMPLE_ID=MMETSP0938 /ASSEMBLY_ACC=CAM_ASM_000576 /LENGTH=409 /DNA_ID=CAMNT_0021591301 /DNA_START=50 /DNA_END=1279 /DNA_ORIENTATION=+